MAVTVNINGLSLVHKGSDGSATASAPDVCITPASPSPVPIPYANVALSADLVGGTTTVTADGGQPVAVLGSKFAVSQGDEAGVIGGVASGSNMHEASFITYSFNVLIEGKPACRLTDQMLMNKGNTVCNGVVQPPVPPHPIVTESSGAPTPGHDWLEFVIVDKDGEPIPNAGYRITLPDGRTCESRTDESGTVAFNGIPSGHGEFVLTAVDSISGKNA